MTVESTVNVKPMLVAPEDQVRADLYALLGNLLLKVPSRATLEQLAALRGEDGVIGSSINTLAQVATSMDSGSVEREYNVLFIGMGRGEVLPYASYYLTGFLHEKPLADLRGSMRELGIQRKEGVVEPEDHLGALCEMMAGMITGTFGQVMSIQTQKEFFNAHIAPWATHCFSDLEAAESAVLYAPVGSLGRLLMGIEQESFRIE
jgi:TorA maturation chaperone TorD